MGYGMRRCQLGKDWMWAQGPRCRLQIRPLTWERPSLRYGTVLSCAWLHHRSMVSLVGDGMRANILDCRNARVLASLERLEIVPCSRSRGWALLRSGRYSQPSQCSTDICVSSSSSSYSGIDEDFRERVGVIIVDHGSKRAASNDMLLEFVQVYKKVTGRRNVEPAHMEIAEPTIEQAMNTCIRKGARTIIVAPYFLSKGRHIQDDIPKLVNAARLKLGGGIDCVIADPIGVDPIMAQLIDDRVKSAIES